MKVSSSSAWHTSMSPEVQVCRYFHIISLAISPDAFTHSLAMGCSATNSQYGQLTSQCKAVLYNVRKYVFWKRARELWRRGRSGRLAVSSFQQTKIYISVLIKTITTLRHKCLSLKVKKKSHFFCWFQWKKCDLLNVEENGATRSAPQGTRWGVPLCSFVSQG